MEKIKRKTNSLIKDVGLKKELQKVGISRVNKLALKYLEKFFVKIMRRKLNLLSRELVVKGKKTLEKGDVKTLFGMQKEKKEEIWEI